jgi:hypothetical protein
LEVLPAASCLASQPFFSKDISFGHYYTKMQPSNPLDQSESFSFSPLCRSHLTTKWASLHKHRRPRSRRPAILPRFTLPLLDTRQPRRQTSSLSPNSSLVLPHTTTTAQIDKAARPRWIHTAITRPWST